MKATTITKYAVEKVLSEEEKNMNRDLTQKGGKAFANLGKDFIKIIETYFEAVYDGIIEYIDNLPEINFVTKNEYWNFDTTKYESQIASVLKTAFVFGEEQQKKSLAGLGISTDLDNDYAVNRANDNAGMLISNVDETTKKRIGNLISNSMTIGISKSDLIKQIQADYSFSKYRATMIVNNELGMALIGGNKKQFEDFQKKTGEVGYKQRVAMEDERDCEDCDMNANDGWILANQMHSSGHMNPTAHVNCRCDEQYLPFPPDGDNVDARLNDFTGYEDVDISTTNEDCYPVHSQFSAHNITPEMYNSLGKKIHYLKKVTKKNGELEAPFFGRMENGTSVIYLGKYQGKIYSKETNAHERGHALGDSHPELEVSAKKILKILEDEVKEIGYEFDSLVLEMKNNKLKYIGEFAEYDKNYRYVEVTRYGKNHIPYTKGYTSQKYDIDMLTIQDLRGIARNIDIPERDKGYYKDNPDFRRKEIQSNGAQIAMYGNTLVETLLPKTYNAIIKYYTDLGFNF